MSQVIHGFLEFNTSDGVVGVSPVGQLSPIGLTYGPSTEYTAPTSPSQLRIFNPQTLPVFATSGWMTTLATYLQAVVNYNATQSSIFNDILSVLGTRFSNVTMGPIVQNPVDSKGYPTYISFTYTTTLGVAQFKIWLVDAAFLLDYPDGIIQIVQPVEPVSNLYNSFTLSKTTVDLLNPLSIPNLIAALPVITPTTGVYSETFRVFNRTNSALWFDLPVAFVYNGGPIHNNPTTFLQAFIDYLLANTNITLDQWEIIIPSLLPTTKFYVIPDWDNISVDGVYPIGSPTIGLVANVGINFKNLYFPELNDAQVDTFINYSVLQFGSMGIFSMPDVSNADGRMTFREKFDDYFVVPTNDPQINKMSSSTQNAIALLTNLVRYASNPTVDTTLPAGTRLEVKNTHKFLYGSVGRVTFAVLIKGS
jgi:hypothetical protein